MIFYHNSLEKRHWMRCFLSVLSTYKFLILAYYLLLYLAFPSIALAILQSYVSSPRPQMHLHGWKFPGFRSGHCSVLRNPLRRNFPYGSLPLPLLGHVSCHLIHRGQLLSQWCNGAVQTFRLTYIPFISLINNYWIFNIFVNGSLPV